MQGLVPRGLARTLPQLAALESFDVPVWGDAKLDLSSAGEILSGTIGIDAAPGQVLLPWLAATPLRIDGGHLALSYSRAARRFEIAPSVLVWGDSRVQFTGSIVHAHGAGRSRLVLRCQLGRRLDRGRAAPAASASTSTTGRRAGSSRPSAAGSCSASSSCAPAARRSPPRAT